MNEKQLENEKLFKECQMIFIQNVHKINNTEDKNKYLLLIKEFLTTH